MSDLLQRYGRSVAKGTVLFREGEPGSEMFVVQSGEVQLSRELRGEGEEVLAVLGAGEFFGEMSILNGKPRTATATVVNDAQLLVLDPKTFEGMLRANTEIAVRMIKKLALRLANANERMETLLQRDHHSRVAHAVLSRARSHGTETADEGISLAWSAEALARHAALEAAAVEEVLARMERSQLLVRRKEAWVVPSLPRLEEFLSFLAMRGKFGDI